jgi:hypothetical protein
MAALGHRLPDVLDPGLDRRQRDEVCADRLGDQPRQGGLSGPRRAPQEERRDRAAGGELTQELAGAQEVLLTGELGQRSRAHTLGEGLSDAPRRGVSRKEIPAAPDSGGAATPSQSRLADDTPW